MTRTRAYHLSIVAPLLGAACGGPAPPPPPPAVTAAPATRAPVLCGEVIFAHDCPADRHAKFECFIRALEECQPAKLRIRTTTIEGGKVVHDLSISRAASGSCEVEGRYDHRGDRFGGKPGVTTTRCKGVKPLEIPSCTTLGMDGC